MVSNKNQHFVPKCHLRPFTIDNAGVAINLYNIDRQKLIRMAPVKKQCSGDYFYGKNERLEKAIQSLEGEYATALRVIQAPGYNLTDQHRHLLTMFWLFQYLRTEEASRRTVEVNEGIRQSTGIDDVTFRLEIRDAVQIAMKTFAGSMGAVADLKVRLIRNRTRVPFLTSDDPAVLTNRWYLQNPRARGRSFGVGSAGAIILLPLSPLVLCLGYDGDVYSVPHRMGWVDVRRQADVEALNEHQFLNCRSNIFVKDPKDAGLVHDGFLRALPLRPAHRHRINYAVKDRTGAGYKRYVIVDPDYSEDHTEALIHVQTVHPAPSRWPGLLSWRTKGRVYTNGTGAGYVRLKYANTLLGAEFWRERSRCR